MIMGSVKMNNTMGKYQGYSVEGSVELKVTSKK